MTQGRQRENDTFSVGVNYYVFSFFVRNLVGQEHILSLFWTEIGLLFLLAVFAVCSGVVLLRKYLITFDCIVWIIRLSSVKYLAFCIKSSKLSKLNWRFNYTHSSFTVLLRQCKKKSLIVLQQSILPKSQKSFTFLGLTCSLKCVQFQRFDFDSQWMAIRLKPFPFLSHCSAWAYQPQHYAQVIPSNISKNLNYALLHPMTEEEFNSF